MKFVLLETDALHYEAAVVGVSVENVDMTLAHFYPVQERLPEHVPAGRSASIALPVASEAFSCDQAICGKVEGATIEVQTLTPLKPLHEARNHHLNILRGITAHRPWGAVEVAETTCV